MRVMNKDWQDLQVLMKASPFSGLPDEALVRLAKILEPQRVDTGRVLCREGEKEERFCILEKGLLKAYRALPSGREITVFLLKPSDSFGFLPLLDGGPFPLSVQAVAPSTVFVLRRQAFLAFLRETPDFSRVLLEHLAGKLRECVDRLGVVTSQGAVARTAHALLSLATLVSDGSDSAEVTLPVSQEELAHTLGVAPENLSRALTRLIKDGQIARAGRRRFRIISVTRLKATAEER